MVSRTGIALVFLFAAFSASVAAQQARPLATLELEELMKVDVPSVFGASKFDQSVLEAPAAVSIVSARDIEVFGYRSLADIIASVPGFNVTYDRNYSYVGVRGFQRPGDYNSRVLVTVDGHRINDPVYDMAYVGAEFPVDVEIIERVELIRGPSSSIYGTNAFFAVINIVTQQSSPARGLQLSAGAGSLGTATARAAFSGRSASGVGVLLSASRTRTDGQPSLYFAEFDDPATNHGVAEHMDRDANYRLFTSLSFKGFMLQAAGGSRRKTVPTASFASSFNDPRFTTTDAQGWADLRYHRELAGRWNVNGRAFYDRNNYDGRYPFEGAVLADYAHVGWWGAEASAETTLAARHRVTAATEFRHNFKLDQGGFDLASGEVFLDDRRASRYSALSVDDQFTISSKWLLNAGVRTDWYEAFGSSTNPRLALIFKPADKTAVKALWGTAFRAPNAYERFYRNQLVQPNPNLRPETIHTSELVVERYMSERYRVMASAYASRIKGLISQIMTPAELLEFVNLESARTRGVEAEVEAKWKSGVGGRLSFSYQRASDLVTHMPLRNSAAHLGTANVTVPVFRRRVIAGFDLHYVGAVETLHGTDTRAFVVPNLTVTAFNLPHHFTFSASAYNFLNGRYAYPGGDEHRQDVIYQNGRTFRAGFTWRPK